MSEAARAVYETIWDISDGNGGVAVLVLCRRTGLGRAAVVEALESLRRKGLLLDYDRRIVSVDPRGRWWMPCEMTPPSADRVAMRSASCEKEGI